MALTDIIICTCTHACRCKHRHLTHSFGIVLQTLLRCKQQVVCSLAAQAMQIRMYVLHGDPDYASLAVRAQVPVKKLKPVRF